MSEWDHALVEGTPMVEPVAWDNPRRRFYALGTKIQISRIDAVPDLARTRDRCRSFYTFAIISTIIVAPIPPVTAAAIM